MDNKNLLLRILNQSDHPDWDQGTECFLAGPLYFDKLENKTPYTRASDLEFKHNNTTKAVDSVEIVPDQQMIEIDEDFIVKCSDEIMKSQENILSELGLTNNKTLPGVVKAMKNQMKK